LAPLGGGDNQYPTERICDQRHDPVIFLNHRPIAQCRAVDDKGADPAPGVEFNHRDRQRQPKGMH
jgi:hypothetical protein